MRTYMISRVYDAPDWTMLPAAPIDNRLWCPEVPIRAQAQLCWDDNALHIRLSAREEQIRAELTGVLDSPCEDSCLEFFFSPIADDGRYFNIEYNPNASLFLGIGRSRSELMRLVLREPYTFDPKPARTAESWEIVYSVPFAFIRLFFPTFRPVPGVEMRANFYKCGDRTPQPHYFSWNPIPQYITPDFHRPEDFGLLCFGN